MGITDWEGSGLTDLMVRSALKLEADRIRGVVNDAERLVDNNAANAAAIRKLSEALRRAAELVIKVLDQT
jgi:hypothetical protein